MAEPSENYEKLLTANLARVIDWLKFSETKNGVLLALASGWTVAAVNVAVRKEGIPDGYEWMLPLSIAILMVAIIRLVWSFMPQISLPKFLAPSARRYRDTNLIFYGDIAEVDVGNAASEMEKRYLPSGKDTYRSEYLGDLAQQIRIVSGIANSKFKAFRTAGWLCFTALVALAWPTTKAIATHLLGW
ncbi:Pycsar system effector family protein [Sphingomonas sp. Leaf28]|uniref:Pycsar system effector family protein n=1 Tax=Sphingomonas sp. Leaf28 TaxID=1735695 RepID=UPI0006F5BB93|nr:Pycsar system effector family protein [Sphingomonas sp. Leaf28]KQN09086.1 hypothetical protein ASE79_14635 [Sphingomonas sp. Leaf28]